MYDRECGVGRCSGEDLDCRVYPLGLGEGCGNFTVDDCSQGMCSGVDFVCLTVPLEIGEDCLNLSRRDCVQSAVCDGIGITCADVVYKPFGAVCGNETNGMTNRTLACSGVDDRCQRLEEYVLDACAEEDCNVETGACRLLPKSAETICEQFNIPYTCANGQCDGSNFTCTPNVFPENSACGYPFPNATECLASAQCDGNSTQCARFRYHPYAKLCTTSNFSGICSGIDPECFEYTAVDNTLVILAASVAAGAVTAAVITQQLISGREPPLPEFSFSEDTVTSFSSFHESENSNGSDLSLGSEDTVTSFESFQESGSEGAQVTDSADEGAEEDEAEYESYYGDEYSGSASGSAQAEAEQAAASEESVVYESYYGSSYYGSSYASVSQPENTKPLDDRKTIEDVGNNLAHVLLPHNFSKIHPFCRRRQRKR